MHRPGFPSRRGSPRHPPSARDAMQGRVTLYSTGRAVLTYPPSPSSGHCFWFLQRAFVARCTRALRFRCVPAPPGRAGGFDAAKLQVTVLEWEARFRSSPTQASGRPGRPHVEPSLEIYDAQLARRGPDGACRLRSPDPRAGGPCRRAFVPPPVGPRGKQRPGAARRDPAPTPPPPPGRSPRKRAAKPPPRARTRRGRPFRGATGPPPSGPSAWLLAPSACCSG